ncbi:hypothetical protein MOO17_11495 [Escherichia coli]|uniref:hypothetical protein n=1 Tax=Escherichia coli TaxID=562 RepID=UPI001FF0F6C6|nr:hypothetical protein [Escherichia coli]MCJ8478654.1 hypothetical protein [Escherichia coli]
MGCFSFLCKESGKAALSTSFDGSPCYLFLLKDGKVIEEMHGNYDSYGRVFSSKQDAHGNRESFKWTIPWSDVCDLMFSVNRGDGIAMVLAEHFTGEAPTERSEDDPNQGWGDGEEEEEEDYFYSTENNIFKRVDNPYHKVHNVLTETEDDKMEIEEDDPLVTLPTSELQKIIKEAYDLGFKTGKGGVNV